MRQRNHLTADQWRRRLDAEMARVLAAPERFDPAVVWWAEWRRTWLAECGSLSREPVARAEVDEGDGLTGPSGEPPRAGETDRTPGLAAGGENWPKTPERGATTAESTTSAHSNLSPNGDNRSARGGNGAAEPKNVGCTRGGGAKNLLRAQRNCGRLKSWRT